jgi:hypothetical protein
MRTPCGYLALNSSGNAPTMQHIRVEPMESFPSLTFAGEHVGAMSPFAKRDAEALQHLARRIVPRVRQPMPPLSVRTS